MDIIMLVLVILAVLVLVLGQIFRLKRRRPFISSIPENWKLILQKDVPFYNRLNEVSQNEFEQRLMYFLSTTQITGVNTTVEDLDKIYIGASAIIPIFGFKGWNYDNLNEVLLYPDSFSTDFEQTGAGRNVLGMVGDGALNRVMVLSQHELRQAFINKTGKTNTAIHEFIHLLDKSDGSVDGVPEFFADKQYVLPWLELIELTVKKITANKSDINPYAASSHAEFFAVTAEYFFERPDLLSKKHPELYKLLVQIFRHKDIEAGSIVYGRHN